MEFQISFFRLWKSKSKKKMPRLRTTPKYKPLPKQFRRKSFTYDLVERVDDVAIYRQSTEDVVVGFEVVLIAKQDATTMKMGGQEIKLEAKEKYPSDGQWGTKGFTLRTERDAFDKFHALLVHHDVVIGDVVNHAGKEFVELTRRVAVEIWETTEIPMAIPSGQWLYPMESQFVNGLDVYWVRKDLLIEEGFSVNPD